MKVATAAYHLGWFSDWSDYEQKIRAWVQDAAHQGARLLVFPEYGAMELSSLAGAEVAGDGARVLTATAAYMERANAVLAALAQEFGVYILGGSGPVVTPKGIVNRAPFFAPEGESFQDKQIMTRFEREDWGVCGGDPLRVFDVDGVKTGVLICYDSEFPLLGDALSAAGVELLLVPSCTETLAGYSRVRIGAMARALEFQCYSVMASLVGAQPQIYGVEENTGKGGIFCPPDTGFPPTGVVAEGVQDQEGWTYATLDFDLIRTARADGTVLNRRDWRDQAPALAPGVIPAPWVK